MEMKNELLNDLMNTLDQEEMKDLNLTSEDMTDKSIKDINEAMFYIKQVKKLREQCADINTIADNEISAVTARIDNWKNSQLSSLTFLEELFKGRLEDYFNENSKDGKPIKTPYGNLTMDKQQDEIEYSDEESVLKFLQENNLNGLIKTEKKIVKKDLKKKFVVDYDKHNVSIDDKVIPGISVFKKEKKFNVK